jgi:hypothetical protein
VLRPTDGAQHLLVVPDRLDLDGGAGEQHPDRGREPDLAGRGQVGDVGGLAYAGRSHRRRLPLHLGHGDAHTDVVTASGQRRAHGRGRTVEEQNRTSGDVLAHPAAGSCQVRECCRAAGT